MELIHLADGRKGVVVRVLGRREPDGLAAEVVVASGFCAGRLPVRLPVRLPPAELDAWASALDDLALGRSVCRLTDARNPEIDVAFDTRFTVPLVTVEDVQGSATAMAVPVDLRDGWIDEQRERLERVRRTYRV
ncbi:hypothetical protein GCM10009759_37820 [Kitasatospora saccharophila]|uniref:Uncharacterized protein n=1 Tax=Kitasatospora saccharophila TaxID=407973 RepID=A0ABN2X0S2_9ACTN